MLNSMACKYEDFAQAWYRTQEDKLKIREIFHDHSAAQVEFVNRKFWEWCVIAQALEERGKLGPGMRGLGFAVGTEPLTSYFASRGCDVLATDLAAEASVSGWLDTNQHAASKNALLYPPLVAQDAFDARVAFQPADMRALKEISGQFDFLWSSCAFEHLGSLQHGIDFVLNSTRYLRPGGIAVHTTEMNVKSDSDTIMTGPSVIYRRKDFIELAQTLKARGLRLSRLDFDTGNHPFDLACDTEPYMQPGVRHLKLDIGGLASTSFLLIIEKQRTLDKLLGFFGVNRGKS